MTNCFLPTTIRVKHKQLRLFVFKNCTNHAAVSILAKYMDYVIVQSGILYRLIPKRREDNLNRMR